MAHRLIALPRSPLPRLGALTLFLTNVLIGSVVGAMVSALPAAADEEPSHQRTGRSDVAVQGVVVDDAGQPVGDATVLLDLRRESFSLRALDREASAPVRMPTLTDADGRFRFDIQPDRYWNRYDVSIAVDVERDGKPGFEILEQQDITASVAEGGPVDLRLRLRQAGFLRWLATFRDGRASADESRLFREQGRPDRIHRASDGVISWWYFETGQVYYLRAGRLEARDTFEPLPDAA